MSEIQGIFQSDITLRTAIIEALRRMRAQPELIDDIFASLANDPLTANEYGQAAADAAKDWFLRTDIPVFMSYRQDEVKIPGISIGLQESSEAEQTHADVHYVPQEPSEAQWPVLAGPFTPVAYAPSSGIMVVPQSVVQNLVLGAGMTLLDAAGRKFPVLEVLDDDTFSIQAGVVADFRNCILKAPAPRMISTVEAVNFRETYVVGCHVSGQSTFLSFLHPIVLYALQKYKQELLEGRGLERTTVTSSPFERNAMFQNEVVFSRSIVVTGYCRQTWRKDTTDRIDAMESRVVLSLPDTVGPPVFDDGTVDVDVLNTEGLVVEEDP